MAAETVPGISNESMVVNFGGKNLNSGEKESDVVSKMQEQNKEIAFQVADLSTGKIGVGGPGETITSKALAVNPEKERFEQNAEKLRSQVQREHEQYTDQFLAQNRGSEIASAVQEIEEKKGQYKSQFTEEKQRQNDALKALNEKDKEEYEMNKEYKEVVKDVRKEQEEKVAKLSKLGSQIEDEYYLDREGLEVLGDPELVNAMFESIEKSDEAVAKLNEEIARKEQESQRNRVQKALVSSYGKILSTLQSVRVFGIDKMARRAALENNLPGVKNDGREYLAQQEVRMTEGKVTENLEIVRDSIEDALVVNEELLSTIRDKENEARDKSKLINLITARIANRKARKDAVEYSKGKMKENITKEQSKLNEVISDVSSKGMNEYTGMDYDTFNKATEDSVVAAKSQEFNIAHKQEVLGSNQSNLEGLTAQTIAERARNENSQNRVNSDIEKALSRIEEARSSQGIAPMTEEERQTQVDKLLEV